jgi:hypothetical protein
MPLRPLLPFLILLVFLITTPAAHAAVKPRPLTGSGVLLIRPPSSSPATETTTITLYREPGVGKLAELPPEKLPSLGQVLKTTAGETAVAVQGKKGTWLRIMYDEAGREGWLQPERHWEYAGWEAYLKGRVVRLFSGLKKGFNTLRREPSGNAPEVADLSKPLTLRIVQLQDNWALVVIDLTASGWLRWRDDEGRFLIVIDESFDPQKR